MAHAQRLGLSEDLLASMVCSPTKRGKGKQISPYASELWIGSGRSSANDRSTLLPDVVALQKMECDLLLRPFALHTTMAMETRRQDF